MAVLHIAILRMEQLLLGWIRSGIEVGFSVDMFRPELESESLEIRRLLRLGYDMRVKTMLTRWLCILWNARTWERFTLL